MKKADKNIILKKYENSKLIETFSYNIFDLSLPLIFFALNKHDKERIFNILFILIIYEKKKTIKKENFIDWFECKISNPSDKWYNNNDKIFIIIK